MELPRISSLPRHWIFLACLSYAGWTCVILTELFWYWSGMASIGVAYLMLVAPVVMLFLAFRLYKQRNQSEFHFCMFWACAGYILIPLGVLMYGILWL
jgi:hypothetical protein